MLIGYDYAWVYGGVLRLYCGVLFSQPYTTACHQPKISNERFAKFRPMRDVYYESLIGIRNV